jgi:hypothetical protein
MSQPVKLSDALVLDARIAGDLQERSIAGQVEFWARLGRSVEPLLEGHRVLSLCRAAAARPLADLVEMVDTPRGREVFANYLATEPYPHYEAHPTQEGLLVRTDEHGVRTVGRFVNRLFVAEHGQVGRHPGASRAGRTKPKTTRGKAGVASPQPRRSKPAIKPGTHE